MSRARTGPWRSRGNRRFGLVLGPIQPTLGLRLRRRGKRLREFKEGRTADVRFLFFLVNCGPCRVPRFVSKQIRPDDGIVSCTMSTKTFFHYYLLLLVRGNSSGCAHSPFYRLPAARERRRSPWAQVNLKQTVEQTQLSVTDRLGGPSPLGEQRTTALALVGWHRTSVQEKRKRRPPRAANYCAMYSLRTEERRIK